MLWEVMATSLISGGFAGMTCDISLFPVDTVKTRLQSKQGFLKAGGFRGIFRGIGSVALGSAPITATFFAVYDTSKLFLPRFVANDASVHMISGGIGEAASCMVRMPFEVVKQTAQASGNFTSRTALMYVIQRDGLSGLYSGLFSTIMRDVPCILLQMPMWEYFKVRCARHYDREVTAIESGTCGGIAGGIASIITTPLDVAKTRIVLLEKNSPDYSENPFRVMILVYKREGLLKLFSGITPRVLWISVGSFLYFSVYEFAKIVIYKKMASIDNEWQPSESTFLPSAKVSLK